MPLASPSSDVITLRSLSVSQEGSRTPSQTRTDNTLTSAGTSAYLNSTNDGGAGGSNATSNSSDTRPTKLYQTMLLLSGFMMTFQVIGINSSFGVFQEYYTSSSSHVKDAYQRDALVSLVGSIAYGLTWSGSIFVNPLIARTERLWLITVPGVVLMSLGLITASWCTSVWQLYLTQAILYGVGASMYYFPIMSVSPIWFNQHRGFAMGVILAGSGVGGLVIAAVLNTIIQTHGAPWALRILGLWNLGIGIPVACVIRHRAGYGSRGHTRMNVSLAKKGTLLYQSLGAFLQAAGNVVPMYYLTTYSVSVLSLSQKNGALILALNNAVNSISRICMGILADKVGRQNTMIVSIFLSALSVFALWYDAPRARFIAFSVMYGIYAGGYNALLPTTITDVYGVQHYASVNGFIYFIRGLGSVLGAPLAGLILGTYKRGGSSAFDGSIVHALQKKYNSVVVYDGVLLLAAGVCVGAVRFLDAREKGAWRWKA